MAAAGFWRRYAAWSLDALLIAAPIALLLWSRTHHVAVDVAHQYEILLGGAGRSFMEAMMAGTAPDVLAAQWLSDPLLSAAIGALQRSLFELLWPPLLAFAALGALYHAVFEASMRQATPAQRLLGLRIVDIAGQRIGAGRALLRHLAGALSWLTLNIGHLLALLRTDKRALHDLASGTRVIQADAARKLPAWAQAWLVLQILVLLWATAAWMSASLHIMQTGFDSAL